MLDMRINFNLFYELCEVEVDFYFCNNRKMYLVVDDMILVKKMFWLGFVICYFFLV